ncbi:MAG: isoprenyl transferase [Saprospiraceae bacterium]|nr:isoprenyl transferase [Saprospiraceae bacterium]MDW8483765.1 isoprenyl transferase [Saprospiraceae bacterium]
MTPDLKARIVAGYIPVHIAIIMDGNGRWAKRKGLPRVLGHRSGVKSVREVTEAAVEIGVKYLTLYTFSTENWSRPPAEVTALMNLLVETVRTEIDDLHRNGVRLTTIGDLSALPVASRKALLEGIEQTRANTRLTLVLALNYSARWEILRAVRQLAQRAAAGQLQPSEIDIATFESELCTAGIPDPDLLIRTGGETRLSNFLLWQSAYTELYFTPVFWPDFGRDDFFEAIVSYQQRERRFGKISEQLVEQQA